MTQCFIDHLIDNLYDGIIAYLDDDEAIASIEYALIAALVAIAAMWSFSALGMEINTVYNNLVANWPL